MPNPKKQNASGGGGASIAMLGGGDKGQKKTLDCGPDHIKKIVSEVQAAGLQLRSTCGDTQLETLPKLLQYLGSRGLNTYEGMAAGYP